MFESFAEKGPDWLTDSVVEKEDIGWTRPVEGLSTARSESRAPLKA
jgi:hypothetical protein